MTQIGWLTVIFTRDFHPLPMPCSPQQSPCLLWSGARGLTPLIRKGTKTCRLVYVCREAHTCPEPISGKNIIPLRFSVRKHHHIMEGETDWKF
jgi:hypothetical protein